MAANKKDIGNETDPVFKNPQKVYTEEQSKPPQLFNSSENKLEIVEASGKGASCSASIREDDDDEKKQQQSSGKYPKIVFLIILNELCERFSYYGLRTVLYIFLTSFIKMDKDTATAVYHAFSMICYFTPVLGAIVSDGYIGLYRTILYVSFIYCGGNVILTLTSMKPLGAPNLIGPAIGLIIISIGTGGIKPCVAAFGGNQFRSNQKKYLETFFSMFYLSINIGSTIGTILTPIFRSDVKCFDNDCYPLAFGVPAVFTFTSIILFIIGTPFYRRDNDKAKGSDNVITKTAGCIFYAVVNKAKSLVAKKNGNENDEPKRAHWIDYADQKYPSSLREDVKVFCRVILIFLPLPLWWAVYDQQGSRWTDQAQRLNGRIGSFTIKPDQFQAVNPILIVILVPLFDAVVYPLFAKIGLLKGLLQRIGAGIIFAMISFLIAAVLEWLMQNSYARLNPGEQIKLFNTLSCKLNLIDPKSNATVLMLDEATSYHNQVYQLPKEYLNQLYSQTNNAGGLTFSVEGNCLNGGNQSIKITNEFKLSTILLYASANSTNLRTYSIPFTLHTEEIGMSKINFIEFDPDNEFEKLNPILSNSIVEYDSNKLNLIDANVQLNNGLSESLMKSSSKAVDYADYKLIVQNGLNGQTEFQTNILLETGGSYSILLFRNSKAQLNANQTGKLDFLFLNNIYAIDIHLGWQVVQIFVITISEIMFSISGITFAYSQAPATMKSVLQASWYMTIAFGNLIVIIVAESRFVDNQIFEYLIFVGLLAFALVTFTFISHFYTYVEDKKKTDGKSDADDDGEEKKIINKSSSRSNSSNINDDETAAVAAAPNGCLSIGENPEHVNYGFLKSGFEKHPTEPNFQQIAANNSTASAHNDDDDDDDDDENHTRF